MVAGGLVTFHRAWSADSSRFLYAASQENATTAEIFSARVDAQQTQTKISGSLAPGGRVAGFLTDAGYSN
jgi:hypothetical protein